MKNNKGITLIALVTTIIVILILAGIGIGSLVGSKGKINTTKDNIASAELSQVQQAILEIYVKYKHTGDAGSFVGTKITWSEANSKLQEIASKGSTTLSLKASNYDGLTQANESFYYKLVKNDFEELGLKNCEDTYIVNYETGEVFNITKKVTNENEALYVNK